MPNQSLGSYGPLPESGQPTCSGPLVCHECWSKKTNHYEPCEHVQQMVRAVAAAATEKAQEQAEIWRQRYEAAEQAKDALGLKANTQIAMFKGEAERFRSDLEFIFGLESTTRRQIEEGMTVLRRCRGRADEAERTFAETLRAASDALKSYAYGNASPDLAKEIAAKCDALLSRVEG